MQAMRPSSNPPPNRFRRLLRRSFVGLCWGATVIALCYGLTDVRGWLGWRNYCRKCAALGASLDLKSYTPKEIPDADNFAAIPLVQSWFDREDTNCVFDLDHFNGVTNSGTLMPARGGDQTHFCDLVAWRAAFAAGPEAAAQPANRALSGQFDAPSRAAAAPAVLEALQDDAAVFDELRRASSRADARYSIEYKLDDPWSVRLPHLRRIKQCCSRLELKACAELALNHTTNALADIKLSLYLADSAKTEPFLISWLVRLACVQVALDPVWEGLAEHRWSAAQLRELQSLFEPYDFYPALENNLRAERAAGAFAVDLIQRKGLPALAGNSDFVVPRWSIARLIPSGWYYQEKLQYCRLLDLRFKGAWDAAARRVSPQQVAANAAAGQKLLSGNFWPVVQHRLIAKRLLRQSDRTVFRGAALQVSAHQAAIACALERYRLARGQYPEQLQSLVPEFMSALPKDVITGQPYKYRRTADGQFILYSVGWNEKDDGGVPGKTLFDQTQGDWVWEYPAQ
jgi:hypothetical protein